MGSCHTWERSNSSSAAAMGKRQPPPTPAPAPALLFLTFNNKTWTLHVDLARTTLRGLQDHVAARTGVPPPAQYLHSGSRPLSARGQLHLRPLATVRLSLRLCGGADRSPAPRSSPTSSDTPLPVAPGNPPDAAAAAAPAAEPGLFPPPHPSPPHPPPLPHPLTPSQISRGNTTLMRPRLQQLGPRLVPRTHAWRRRSNN